MGLLFVYPSSFFEPLDESLGVPLRHHSMWPERFVEAWDFTRTDNQG